MSVSAIIVNYHTAAYLPDLTSELLALAEMEQVFVVDNSGEVTLSSLQEKLSPDFAQRVALLKPGRNIGFGAGVNLAAAGASSDYLLVINPDVKLFPQCLEHLLAAARKYGSVLTGPRFYWDKARRYRLPPSQGASSWLDYAYGAAGRNRLEFEHLSFYWQMRHERFWTSTAPFAEIFLTGACVLIHRPWAMENGATVFDERFFLYFEDNDISLRAHFDGVPPLCIPAAEALHHYDQSPSPEKSKGDLMARSHGQFAGKHYGKIKAMIKSSGHYFPDIDDLGQVLLPATFDVEGIEPAGSLYFEMGVNPFFVPFAQTDIDMANLGRAADGFVLDQGVWNRLAKGIYYGRIRDSIKGTLKIWKWQKV